MKELIIKISAYLFLGVALILLDVFIRKITNNLIWPLGIYACFNLARWMSEAEIQ